MSVCAERMPSFNVPSSKVHILTGKCWRRTCLLKLLSCAGTVIHHIYKAKPGSTDPAGLQGRSLLLLSNPGNCSLWCSTTNGQFATWDFVYGFCSSSSFYHISWVFFRLSDNHEHGIALLCSQDAHLSQMVKAFECVSSTFIEMGSLTALQREFAGSVRGQMPFGCYAIKQKTQAGRLYF